MSYKISNISGNADSLSDTVKDGLMKVGQFATKKIGAVLQQYFNYHETMINVGFQMSEDKEGIMNVYAYASRSGLYFSIDPDSEGKDLVITMIAPTDLVNLEKVRKIFQQNSNGFNQKQNSQLN